MCVEHAAVHNAIYRITMSGFVLSHNVVFNCFSRVVKYLKIHLTVEMIHMCFTLRAGK